MIRIYIDTREILLFNELSDRELENYSDKINIINKSLEIGDIHFVFNDYTYIFERKSVSDMLSSIKDGRYKEQKLRLLASGYNISYIIEGDNILSCFQCEKNKKILSSSYIHTIYRDKINIIFTKNITETSTFLLTFATKIIENPEYFIKNYENKNYIDNIKIKSKKIENITPDNCFIMQLSQIPFISSTIAKNIKEKYNNMRIFIKSIEESDDKLNLLMTIDKIGIEKAKKILEYFHF